MPNKQQFWDYIVTLEIKVSAQNREEAKRIVMESFLSLPIPNASVTILRVKPVIKK